ncbi:hypothetical protein HYU12_00860 [Candidatus Woesearchaeota archaeon]|nr:hypothetical protein [Candidatus Woesearchaeota archaeon]
MTPASYAEKLEKSQGLQDIFELVKEIVWKSLKVEQAGLLVGLAELGITPQRILGAFYSPEANTIIMNRTVMNSVKHIPEQQLYKSYCFHILLHEYLHSCGFYDEAQNRQIVAAITEQAFGDNHFATKLATTPDAMPSLMRKSLTATGIQGENLPDYGIEFIEGIDRENTNYIN